MHAMPNPAPARPRQGRCQGRHLACVRQAQERAQGRQQGSGDAAPPLHHPLGFLSAHRALRALQLIRVLAQDAPDADVRALGLVRVVLRGLAADDVPWRRGHGRRHARGRRDPPLAAHHAPRRVVTSRSPSWA